MFWLVTQPLSKVSRAFRNTQSLRLYLTVELWIASTAITCRLQRDSQSCDIPLDLQKEMVENIVTALRWENETYPRTWNHLQNDSLDLKVPTVQHKKWFDFRATLPAKEQNRSTSICNVLFLNWVFFHFSARLWTEETKWELMFDATRIISAFWCVFFPAAHRSPLPNTTVINQAGSGESLTSEARLLA